MEEYEIQLAHIWNRLIDHELSRKEPNKELIILALGNVNLLLLNYIKRIRRAG